MQSRIRDVRRAKGLTLADVAMRCNPPTTAQTIGRLETGMRVLSLIWINRIADALGVEQVRYRIYYSQDNLTCRLFVFRPHCTPFETETMLGMGFVPAQDGDTENIPDQPVEEVEK